jgi:hypothetical protein
VADFKMSDLDGMFDRNPEFVRELIAQCNRQTFTADVDEYKPLPLHVRAYYRVRNWVYTARVRLGEVIAGQKFGDDY